MATNFRTGIAELDPYATQIGTIARRFGEFPADAMGRAFLVFNACLRSGRPFLRELYRDYWREQHHKVPVIGLLYDEEGVLMDSYSSDSDQKEMEEWRTAGEEQILEAIGALAPSLRAAAQRFIAGETTAEVAAELRITRRRGQGLVDECCSALASSTVVQPGLFA